MGQASDLPGMEVCSSDRAFYGSERTMSMIQESFPGRHTVCALSSPLPRSGKRFYPAMYMTPVFTKLIARFSQLALGVIACDCEYR
jgi:hypothetical protein